jgi:hypothetical protein
MAYLLDANIFIQAKNLHYGFDFCPAFWDWLIKKNQQGQLFSISRVGDELIAGNDTLANWAQDRGDKFFLEPNQQTLPPLGQVSEWITKQNYVPAAINTFLQVADYYLIAQAIAGNHTVVTHEVISNSNRRIKIPDVCIGLKIKYVNPYQMLQREQAKFVLG